jgi:hypothetical protein
MVILQIRTLQERANKSNLFGDSTATSISHLAIQVGYAGHRSTGMSRTVCSIKKFNQDAYGTFHD